MSTGLVDLHCHCIPAVDDGVRSVAEAKQLLRALKSLGFDRVVATPHTRPSLFEEDRASLTRAFEALATSLAGVSGLPELALASEHYLDDIVFGRLVAGAGLPYPGGRAVLVEVAPKRFPPLLDRRLFDLRRRGLTPVLAHPERYAPVWADDRCLDPLLDVGTLLLLDVCAIVGKYGARAQKAAEKLLDDEAYEAAATDCHAAADAEIVERALLRLGALVGAEESERLLSNAPRAILSAE